MIAAVRHNPRFAGGIAFSLRAGIGEIQVLNALDLDVQPRQRFADHVGDWETGELLAAPGVKTVLAQERQIRVRRPCPCYGYS